MKRCCGIGDRNGLAGLVQFSKTGLELGDSRSLCQKVGLQRRNDSFDVGRINRLPTIREGWQFLHA